MGHSMGTMSNKKTLVIAAVLLVSALIAVYGFNVAWRSLVPFAFVAFFVWMHAGGHSMHSGNHSGYGDTVPRDEHAGSTPASVDDNNAQALASGTGAKSEAREVRRRHGGC